MLNTNVSFDHVPERVLVEPLPNGMYRVVMHGDVLEESSEEGASYVTDEVVFTLSYPISDEEVEASFSEWWDFGTENDSDREELSMEERLNSLEAGFTALLLGR